MTLPLKPPNLQDAPDEYDRDHMDGLIKELRLFVQLLNAEGPLKASTINLSALPSAGYGQPVGTVFEVDGVLKVVRSKDHYFMQAASATGAVGTTTQRVFIRVTAPSLVGTGAVGTVTTTP